MEEIINQSLEVGIIDWYLEMLWSGVAIRKRGAKSQAAAVASKRLRYPEFERASSSPNRGSSDKSQISVVAASIILAYAKQQRVRASIQ